MKSSASEPGLIDPCTRLRTDGVKAMSHGFSGSKQVVKAANARNRGRVCLL